MKANLFLRRTVVWAAVVSLAAGFLFSASAPVLFASHTPNPTSVTMAGSFDNEIGCSGDWQADCAAAHLAYDANDDVWQNSFAIPAGVYEYKAALNDGWAENYGWHAVPNGPNIPLALGSNTTVKFYYDHKSHWVTDNYNSVIAVAPGNFQSELGCSGDWDPGCLRSWLQDIDGDGIYMFETTALPMGSYEAKVALNESWDVNYGAGCAQNGPNIPFNVPANGAKVKFSYNATTHCLTITAGHAQDNNVEWDGLRHDSRDWLYRTPGGAVPAGTPVKIRFRTFHNDVTRVTMRLYDVNASAQSFTPMQIAASDVSCYQAALANDTCDFWEATVNGAQPDNFWYRFIVADGTKTAYYADNTSALDGGSGAPSDNPIDQSYALMFYDAGFTAPSWARQAVIYQIFPDRFRNGDTSKDPQSGQPRYDDPVLALPWGTLPEGYCRSYADANVSCPWRFDNTPPPWSPTIEQPRGRDYMGGDLQGVTQKLGYLQALGVTAIYFNPIFAAKSNHRYDTADYLKIDPALGSNDAFGDLIDAANPRGIKVIVDGVFNHMSSDSPNFDRYHHYKDVGACESAGSAWRAWFYFRPPQGSEPQPCVPSTPGGNDTYYDGWFGFDSIPVLNKSLPAVQNYFVGAPNSVTRMWLRRGASAWRLDVMGDPSFPNGYWESFRQVAKQTKADALIIGELWQKDTTLLRFLRGDRADTTMNYRLRDAVLAFLAPQNFDPKGFADSGRSIKPSEFAARLSSIREDYPDAAYYSLMNLLDSHDTERLLWTLTPGAFTRQDRELNAANFANGKQRLQIASLIQFSVPGAPTVYYGDEVGMTGADDPDDRRTYPWADIGGSPDNALFTHYQTLASLRKANPVLIDGDLRFLTIDDANNVVAFGRKTGSQGAVVAINRSEQARTFDISVVGYLPEGTALNELYRVNNAPGASAAVAGGKFSVSLNPLSARLFATNKGIDLTPPSPPTNLSVANEGNGQVSLDWSAVSDAAGYNVYISPVSGGGYIKVNNAPLSSPRTRLTLPSAAASTNTAVNGLRNAQTYYFVVTALDAPGNESPYSNEVSALPHLTIGWANLQWPPTMAFTISAVNHTDNAYGQVWIDGETNKPGATPSLRAQLGFGPHSSNPANNAAWTWIDASFNTDAGNNDEFVANMQPDAVGTYDYLYRYTTTNGRDWLYADLNGPIPSGAQPPNPGVLTVNPSSDTTPPATPTGLHVVSASPAGIELAWDAVGGDPTLYGYEVLRGNTAGGPYAKLALITNNAYTDASVVQDATYYYVVRAVDTSFNRSGNSNEVQAKAALRKVNVVFMVTVPSSTDATGRSVYIAGTLSRLDGGLPDWNPGAVNMTRVDSTHWTVTLTGNEGVQIEYKYTLGDWDHVEKGASCAELGNRLLTLSYGTNGTQNVNDTVLNWRNVSPCGN